MTHELFITTKSQILHATAQQSLSKGKWCQIKQFADFAQPLFVTRKLAGLHELSVGERAYRENSGLVI